MVLIDFLLHKIFRVEVQ